MRQRGTRKNTSCPRDRIRSHKVGRKSEKKGRRIGDSTPLLKLIKVLHVIITSRRGVLLDFISSVKIPHALLRHISCMVGCIPLLLLLLLFWIINGNILYEHHKIKQNNEGPPTGLLDQHHFQSLSIISYFKKLVIDS